MIVRFSALWPVQLVCGILGVYTTSLIVPTVFLSATGEVDVVSDFGALLMHALRNSLWDFLAVILACVTSLRLRHPLFFVGLYALFSIVVYGVVRYLATGTFADSSALFRGPILYAVVGMVVIGIFLFIAEKIRVNDQMSAGRRGGRGGR